MQRKTADKGAARAGLPCRTVRRPSAICSDEPSVSGRGTVAAAAAAALLAAALALGAGAPAAWAGAAPPAAAGALAPVADVAELALAAADEDVDEKMDEYDRDMSELAERVDPEVVMPRELRDFLQMFEKGTPRDVAKLEAARERVGFRRGPDGRVSLLSDGGEEFAVKADMQAPGYLLLRDSRGYCYYLPPDPSGRLAQIDLSDDVLVAQLFANRLWEDVIEPLEVLRAPEDGRSNASAAELTQLRLGEAEFRAVASLLEGAQELPEEPLEDVAAAEGDGLQQ